VTKNYDILYIRINMKGIHTGDTGKKLLALGKMDFGIWTPRSCSVQKNKPALNTQQYTKRTRPISPLTDVQSNSNPIRLAESIYQMLIWRLSRFWYTESTELPIHQLSAQLSHGRDVFWCASNYPLRFWDHYQSVRGAPQCCTKLLQISCLIIGTFDL